MASWLNNAIFYEIYPQSFNDSNGDGIGDFQGIIDKLQYVRDLGCNAIWINPCFDSSFYDAGYDVRDYYTAAERYGSNADLQRLFERAHELGMHVLLDLVPGHSAVDNPWFLESGKDERNAWTDRYIWRPMTQSPNLNSPYESIRGFLGGIAERPDAAAVNCFSTQACLNYGFGTVTEDWQFAADSPEAVQGRLLIQDIMDFWLGLGADGFRVDMAGSLVKEDPDHYWTKLLWQQVRAHLDETYPEAVLVSEWGDPEEALHAGFDMDFLLHFGPSHYLDLFRENPYFSAGSSEATGSAETAETEHDGEHSECDGAGSSGCDSNGNSVVDGGIEFLYAEDHAYPLVYARSSEAGEAERDATDGERSGTAHETSCETPCETCSKINREAGGERIVVAINPSNTDASCTLPSDYVKLLSGGLAQEISQEPAEKTVLLSIGNPARFDGTQLHVPARSATILPC